MVFGKYQTKEELHQALEKMTLTSLPKYEPPTLQCLKEVLEGNLHVHQFLPMEQQLQQSIPPKEFLFEMLLQSHHPDYFVSSLPTE